MASYFKIHWRRGRQLRTLPPAFPTAPPPPAGEPVTAWTPRFQRTRNLTRRRLPVDNPFNPDYPATPEPPFAIPSVLPAISLRRRETRRTPRPLPKHDEYTPTTTRITHLTSSVLYGQGPPTTRITHLTAAVIYRRPTSQNVPERDRKDPTKRGKKRKSSYPIGQQRNRIKRQLPPHFVFPETPPGFFQGFYPGSKRVETLESEFERRIQRLPELDEYPETPPEFYPAYLPPPTLTQVSRRKHQALPELDSFPATTIYPSYLPPPTLKQDPARTLQALPELDVYPATPRYPSYLPPPSYRVDFDRSLQALPEHDEHPPTPVSADDYGGYTPAVGYKISFERRLRLPLNPHVYPPTPAGFFDGFYPAPFAVEAFTWSFDREIQPLELNEFPVTRTAEDWPAWRANEVRIRTSERRLQTSLPVPEFPETPVSADDYAGFTPVRALRRRVTERRLIEPAELNERPQRPGYFAGFYPGSSGIKALRQEFSRKFLDIPEHNVYPRTPVPLTAFTQAIDSLRSRVDRARQALPELNVYPATPVVTVAAFAPAPAANRIRSERRLLLPLELNEHPPTPPSIIEMPAPWAAKSIRRNELGREIQPVWNPSVIVGEAFKDHSDDCKIWFACKWYGTWRACSTENTWRADPICD